MSLVGDALRKARKDSAFRAQPPRGGVVVPPTSPPRSGPRIGLWVLIGVLAGAAVAVVGGAGMWWVLGYRGEQVELPRDTDAAQTVELRPSEIAEMLRPEAGPPIEGVAGDSGDLGVAQPGDVPPIGRETEASRAGFSADPASTETGRAASDDRPSAGAATEESPAEESDERIFLVEADLGYARLTVDYIVYRSDDPFAEINGLEVHEGSRVAGFVVEKIERDLVRLRDDRGPLILRVHPVDVDSE